MIGIKYNQTSTDLSAVTVLELEAARGARDGERGATEARTSRSG
jgi:hypothetical protein